MATEDTEIRPSTASETKPPNDAGPENETAPSQFRAFLSAIGISVVSMLLLGLWTVFLGACYYALTGGIDKPTSLLLENLGLLLSAITLGLLFLQFSDHSTDFYDFELPSVKQTLIGLGGAVVLLIASNGIAFIFQQFGISGSQHAITQMATGKNAVSPEFFLLLIPVSIFLIGPCEEFIYRNIVQKSLYPAFGKTYAILSTSIIFAAIHFPAYLTGTPGEAVITLLSVLALSLVLGGVYASTEKLAVPAIAHGVYNAILFFVLYADLTNLM